MHTRWLTGGLVAVQDIQPAGEQLQHFVLKNREKKEWGRGHCVTKWNSRCWNMATGGCSSSEEHRRARKDLYLFSVPLQHLLFTPPPLSSQLLQQILILCSQGLQETESGKKYKNDWYVTNTGSKYYQTYQTDCDFQPTQATYSCEFLISYSFFAYLSH